MSGNAVEIRNVSRYMEKLTSSSRVFQAQRSVVEKATAAAKLRAIDRAPGSLGGHITSWIVVRGLVVEGVVRMGTVTRNGFRYPWALQASKRIRYHYRSGPRRGLLTLRWFTGAKFGIKKRMLFDLRAEAEGIRVWWRS